MFYSCHFFGFLYCKKYKLKTYFLILRSLVSINQSTTINMSAAQQRNYITNAAEYLNAAKRGIEHKSVQESNDNDYDRDSSSSSDDEVQTRSKTTKKAERRTQRIAAKQQQKKHAATKPQQEEEESSSPIVEKRQKLTKRQQVLQRYADDEARGVASILESMADAAITRSQARNQNTVVWTERDRAAASRAATIAFEVATEAAEAAQGKKKKEQPSPYWTRLHEKNRSVVRFQKEIGRVMECDFY